MKHKHNNRSLGRTRNKRRALLKNLGSSLLEHGSIKTTKSKAKELKKYLEPLITEAKGDLTLARRRQLLKGLNAKSDLPQLVVVAKKNKDRPGGYTRMTNLPQQRHDAAQTVRIDIIDWERA